MKHAFQSQTLYLTPSLFVKINNRAKDKLFSVARSVEGEDKAMK